MLLTGATGFLGGEIAVLLSKSPRIRRLFCLVRAADAQTGADRLARVFKFHGDDYDSSKVIAVVGDLGDKSLAQHLCGLEDLRNVETIIHAAADTSFSPVRAAAIERVNIGGTRQILSWSRTLPGLQTFLYVGTASICGTQLANSHIHEDQSPDIGASHLVKYCYSKMVGEMEVRAAIPKEKLLIVRPSIVMGDSRSWKPRSYVILWALAVLDAIRLIPANPHASVDVVPVDYAAKAITELLFTSRNWTTYHISSGKESSTTLEKTLSVVQRGRAGRPEIKFVRPELIEQMKRWPRGLKPACELLGYAEHLAYWSSTFDGALRLLVRGMKPYFRFIDLNQTFDNSRLLSDTKLAPPPPSHEYARVAAKYLDEIDLTAGALDP